MFMIKVDKTLVKYITIIIFIQMIASIICVYVGLLQRSQAPITMIEAVIIDVVYTYFTITDIWSRSKKMIAGKLEKTVN
jgi:hypothetical protein